MSWFKNLLVYCLSREVLLSAEEMEKKLGAFTFIPCGSQDMKKIGWVSPMGFHDNDALAHVNGGQILICARKEEKILPAPVIQQELQAKIDRLEIEQQRKLNKTEKNTLKEEVLYSLMPRAFSRFSQTFIWIDTVKNMIIVDAVSANKAEDVLALLRKSLGSLPVVPLTIASPIKLTLTKWVRSGEVPAGFSLQSEAELQAIPEEGGIIRCKKQALVSDEIATHIESGKLVTKLAVEWQERIAMVLIDDGSIKRLRFSDIILVQNENIDREDLAGRFDADFVLMTSELAALIQNLIKALSGEA